MRVLLVENRYSVPGTKAGMLQAQPCMAKAGNGRHTGMYIQGIHTYMKQTATGKHKNGKINTWRKGEEKKHRS